jgi:NADH dehydrogenase FAD-containing subunit
MRSPPPIDSKRSSPGYERPDADPGRRLRRHRGSVELRRLQPEHEVLLVDSRPAFAMGLRRLWELVGHATITAGSRERRLLEPHGIEFVQAEITSIDPAGRSAETSTGTVSADHLIVAPGAVSRPDLLPGLVEHPRDTCLLKWTAGS